MANGRTADRNIRYFLYLIFYTYEDRHTLRLALHHIQLYLVYVMALSSERQEGPCVYVRQMKLRKGWQSVVLLGKTRGYVQWLGVWKSVASMQVKGGFKILRNGGVYTM